MDVAEQVEIKRIVNIRDHLKKKSHKIFIEDGQKLHGLLSDNRSLAPLFQSLFANVAPIKINVSNAETHPEPQDEILPTRDLESAETQEQESWDQGEFNQKIGSIAADAGFVFINCNYFQIRADDTRDDRVFAPNLVDKLSPIQTTTSKGTVAFRILQDLRRVFQEYELLPIVDFIRRAAPFKRSFAIEFRKESPGEGKLWDWVPEKADSDGMRETKAPLLRICLEDVFADYLSQVREHFEEINSCLDAGQDESDYKACIRLIEATTSQWIKQRANRDKINDRLAPLAKILDNWFRLPDASIMHGTKQELLNTKGRENSSLRLPPELCGMDVFSILISLFPLKELLGVTCHYSYPCEIRMGKRTNPGDDSCSILTIGTCKSIGLTGRKMLSDLTYRVMLIPLAEQLIWLSEDDAKFDVALGKQISESVLKAFKRNQPGKLNFLTGGYTGDGTFIFADISGYSQFTKDWKATLTKENMSPHILSLLKAIWKVIGQEVIRNGGAVGTHAGDGAFIFFPDVLPFTDLYPAKHSLRAFYLLSRLSERFRTAIDHWETLGEGKDYLAHLESDTQRICPPELERDKKRPCHEREKMRQHEWIKKRIHALNLHVAVHSGRAAFGSITDGVSYTAIGHDVNECSRLQEIANEWEIALFETYWRNLNEALQYVDLPDAIRIQFFRSNLDSKPFSERYKDKKKAKFPKRGKLAEFGILKTMIFTEGYFLRSDVVSVVAAIDRYMGPRK